MLKDRLYYQDPYTKSFVATIVRNGTDSGGRPYTVLSNTAFYPTGGGQPHDTGMIAGVPVVEVEEVNGEIRHFLEHPLGKEGTIPAEIDWDRRFDHMQQHTGQHILTAALVELFGYPTVSFHLGREIVTIDIDREFITEEELAAAERLANQVILENRPIEQRWVTRQDLDQYSLRKDVNVDGEIRLVIIPDFDTNGCGGTHPTSTGQVAALKILSSERQKRQTRVHFVCGGRVLEQFGAVHGELTKTAQLLSAPLHETAAAAEQLLQTQHSLEKQLAAANEQLLDREAERLAGSKGLKIRHTYEGLSMQELQKIARKTVALRDHVIVTLVSETEDKLQFVLSRSAGMTPDLRTASSIALQAINGKGGGSAAIVQGGGERLMGREEFAELLERSIPAYA